MRRYFRLALFNSSVFMLLVICGCSTGNNTSPVIKTSGSVSIATDHSRYQPTDRIQVTVTNLLKIPIYALDTRASCSILGLQMLINNTWRYSKAAPCILGRHAVPVKIDAGETSTATISAGVAGSTQAAFPPGTYRLVLAYATSIAELGSSKTTTIYSGTFEVTE